MELNAPFYRWPKPETVRRWKREAHRNFVYSVKVNGVITHDKRFAGTKKLIKDFCSLAEVLGSHMGCFLFQMPPSFRYSASLLRRMLDQLDPRRHNVLEFRHRGWWCDEVYDAMREASAAFAVEGGSAIFCCSSGPRMPPVAVRTAPDLYVRFHGVKRWYRHDYSREELTQWLEAVRGTSPQRVWVYFNNDHDAYAIKNARAMKRLINVVR